MPNRKQTGFERRQHPRSPFHHEFMIAKSRGAKTFVRILDLSEGGFSLESPIDLKLGSHLFLTLTPPIRIRGQIRQVRYKRLSNGGIERIHLVRPVEREQRHVAGQLLQ